MNQIIMLNHAAWFNGKKMDARVKKGSTKNVDADGAVWGNKKLCEMDSNDMAAYYADLGAT